MKQPFILLGGAALSASFLLAFGGWTAAAAIFVLAAIIVFCLLPKDKRLRPKFVIILVILLILCLRFVTLDLYISHKSDKLRSLETDIVGIVTDVKISGDVSRFTINIEDSAEKEAAGITAAGYMFGAVEFSPGDRISGNALFQKPDDRYKAINFDKGEYFYLKLKDYYISKKGADPLYTFAENMREGILSAVNSLGPDEESKLLCAVIIGEKHSDAAELYNISKTAGVSHMLVVSGLHLGIMCGILMRLLKGRTNRRLTVFIMISFVLFVALVCFFHISILRAGITYIIMLIGMTLLRNRDPVNSLGAAVTILVFFFPYIFYNVAFMLSVSATFAVIGPAGRLIDALRFAGKKDGLLKRGAEYVFEVIIIAVCALILTLPITVYYFGSVSLIAPLSNLLLSFSVTGMLAFGLLGVALWFLPLVGKPLCLPFIFVAKLFASYFLFAVKAIVGLGVGFVEMSPSKSFLCGIFTVLFIISVYTFCHILNLKKEKKSLVKREIT